METFLLFFVMKIKVKFLQNKLEQLDTNFPGLADTEHKCRDYWYGALTTLFIFLPSCNVLSAIYGPSTASILCSIWGDIFMASGILIWGFDSTLSGGVLSWFLFLLGLGLTLLGSIGKYKRKEDTTFCLRLALRIPQIISFPFFILISPGLIPLIKFLNILRPTNKFIENQMKLADIR